MSQWLRPARAIVFAERTLPLVLSHAKEVIVITGLALGRRRTHVDSVHAQACVVEFHENNSSTAAPPSTNLIGLPIGVMYSLRVSICSDL